MADAVSILNELRNGKYEASILATYNAFFPFYEDVLLRQLSSLGCRHNILLMDARQCGAALGVLSSRPRLAGRAYSLLPVRAGQAFHPKMMLLIGKGKGLLFVGSHNVTLAGFSHNREITNRFEYNGETESESLAAMQSAWKFIRIWAASLPKPLQSGIEDIENFAKWLKGETSEEYETQLVGASPEGPALWKKVRPYIPEDIIRITVVGPFFDSELRFLKRLKDDFSPSEFIVGIEPSSVSIPKAAERILPGVKYVDANCLKEGVGYLHAKAILFESRGGKEVLITGSANPSSPAWLSSPGRRNAEVVIIRTTTKRKSLAKELGLKDLAEQMPIGGEEWNSVSEPGRNQESTQIHTPLVALAIDGGFEIDSSLLKEVPHSDARLLNPSNELLGLFTGELTDEGGLFVSVPDEKVHGNAAFIEFDMGNGELIIAIIHHEKEITEASLTGRQRALKDALNSLEGSTPMLEDFMRIVEKVIFDEVGEAQFQPPSVVARDKIETEELPPIQTDFKIPLRDIKRHKKYKKASISPNDLGLLLDALIHRLGKDLSSGLHDAPSYFRSEEDLVGSEDEELSPRQEIDGEQLVQMCHRKVRKLFRRMVSQLENAAKLPERSLTAIAQTAAVLGLIQRLRELDSQTVPWMPKGETLVPEEPMSKFFLDISRLLYSPKFGIMKSALSTRDLEACLEATIIRGLLLTLAWDCEFEFGVVRNEDVELLQERLAGLARLVLMAQDVLSNQDACEQARGAITRLQAIRASKNVENWIDDYLGWATIVVESCPNSLQTARAPKQPETGDIVFPVNSTMPQPYVVINAYQNKVYVIDVDDPKGKKIFAQDYVTVLNLIE